jgi:tRNA U34 5-carboxymethylaminomethyl modifying enzyme MnmG/GidA
MGNKELTVGQRVYLLRVGNNARYYKGEPIEKLIEEVEIAKVGRKYIEIKFDERFSTVKFNKEDLRQVTEYSADWKLYLSKQDIFNEKESEDLSWKIRQFFDYGASSKLTLEQLRKINDIIEDK